MSGEHPERILPSETPVGIIEHHLAKYRFAAAQGLPGPILDVACGVGYASEFLTTETGHWTVGVDISSEAMAVAAEQYLTPSGASFAQADATRLPFPDGCFASAVGFETVEHVPDQLGYVREVRRVLRPGGLFVCSTPYVKETDPAPDNPFHVLELDADDLASLLRNCFNDVTLYTQTRIDTNRARTFRSLDVLGIRRHLPTRLLRAAGRAVGTPPTVLRQANDFAVIPGAHPGTEIIAVCR